MLRGYDSLAKVESATPSPIADRYIVPEELASSITFGDGGAQALGGTSAPVFRWFRACVPSVCLVFE